MPGEEKVPTSAQRSPEEAAQSRQPVAERIDEQRRAVVVGRMILIGAVLATISIGSYVLLYFQTGAWQILVDVAGLVLGVTCLAPARRSVRRGKLDTAGYWILLALVIVYGTGELVWADATLPQTVTIILLIVLVSSVLRPRRWGVWLVTAGLYVIYVFLVNRFEPLPRYAILASAPVTQLINVPLALAVLWQVARAFRIGTIRTRLLIAFMLMVLLSAAAISAGSIVLSFRSGRQQVINQLESVATLKETEIEKWVNSLQTDLVTALAGEDPKRRTIALLQMPDPSKYLGYWVRNHFQQAVEQAGRFEELFLIDLQGQVLLSTDAKQEGKTHSNQTFFLEGLKGSCVEPPFYFPSPGQMSVVVVRPVVDEQGHVWGVLAGRASMTTLNKMMLERAGLGQTGEAYLIGHDHALLTESRSGEEGIYVRTQGANAALEAQVNGAGLYDDYRGVPVVGVYHWLPELQVALLAEQNQSEAFGAKYRTLGINVGVALASVLLAMVASLFITRSIAIPLANLAETATQIAAGDLERVAKVEREDEIGALAQAFNSMTAQLRGLIGSLEQRVADRTRELEHRSAYLEASAEVGRAATLVLGTDRLIQRVVELIRERFGLYYVGLFLVDETDEWAVLRAGTGEAGRAMLARGHRLQIGGGSMVGWSIAHAQARLALEGGEDAVRLATTELPDTRSEAALPLRSRGQVIGALTVQHTQPGAFDQDTLVLLQTMADQVAVALDNARLFAESQAALEATRRAYGELSGQAWAELLRARPNLGYRSDEHGVTSAEDIWRPEMERALQEGQTIQGTVLSPTLASSVEPSKGDGADTETKRPLAVPIKVRGNVIGVLDTYKPGDAGQWTPEEIALLETLADQLGVALEDARLYQDAQHRAAREQLTREITDRMRRATGVEDIVQTAVDALSRVLGTSRTFVRLGVVPSSQEDGKDGS